MPAGLDFGVAFFDVIVSKDGRSVYVSTGDSIVGFIRNTATGALTFRRCVRDRRILPRGCRSIHELRLPGGMDLSDDGKSLYVAGGHGITWFDRDPETGRISFKGCLQGTVRERPCRAARALVSPRSVDVSADGGSVLVAASGTLVNLQRDQASGDLSFRSCFRNKISPADGDITGPSVCIPVPALGGAFDVVVSDDGRTVYTTAFVSNAVSVYSRLAGGAIRFDSCLRDAGSLATGCTSVPALRNPSAVDVSKDGASVYVTSLTSDALVSLIRDRNTGKVTFDGCHRQRNLPPGPVLCAQEAEGLGQPRDVEVSDDAATGGGPGGGVGGPLAGGTGKSVYVAGSSNAVAIFNREPPGLVVNPPPPDTQIDAGPESTSKKR